MGSVENIPETAPDAIPTVDISPFTDPNASEEAKSGVVDAIRHACTKYGFFYLTGHGVSEEKRNSVLKCARRFFELSPEERMEVWVGKSMGKSFRGYEPPGIQTHQEGLLPDTKESFMIGHEVPADHPDAGTFSTGPNLWPKNLKDEEFRTPAMEYQATMLALSKVLLKLLSRGLPKAWGHPPDVMDEIAVNPSMPMRLLHYAPQEVLDERQFGVGDHTDFGCVTILLQEMGTKGLEVWYPPTETWIAVPPKENSYVINMGDMMQKWTSGYYRSARHRVITSGTNDRYSVPWFLNGQLKLKCKALDGSGVETIVGEHIRQRLIATMGKTGKALE
ncbi:putative leucoanthocyanidin dioxygenase [Daldinia vernicosa]|uniref:putative leucoanthocyanidin dioxygenase n=1 Tax=Daldinia vernicosa TaxID=114800 RepID=UPI002008A016|nr:putative leucoanthocyanidin dioxygenase [Daldinia vernicosa]KAI0845068.1 putative leucoanthocyanidin dioxygenase [Daldinia vernicosa]